MTTADPPRPAGRAEFRARSLRGWDVAFYLMTAIGAGAFLTEPPGPEHHRAVGLGALAVLVVGYTVVGRRAARTAGARAIAGYLVLLLAAVAVAVWSSAAGSLLLFIAFSQVWYFAESRARGIAWSVALSACVLGASVVREDAGWADVPSMAAEVGLALVFALLLGLWVTQVAEQGELRAALLEELQATQAELGRSHHAAGVAAERERMAREIHDTLAQGFTSVVMLSQATRADLARGALDRATERVDLVERTARENLAEARALVAAFAPVDLTDGSLGEALDRLAERFTAETGVPVDVVVPGRDGAGLARETEVVLLRAAQEALSNVRRHARAGRVQLVLSLDPPPDAGGAPGAPDGPGAAGAPGRSGEDGPRVRLEVVDDGRGFDVGAARGYGLRGMQERVATGGGEVDVTSGESGTRVRVVLPVRGREVLP